MTDPRPSRGATGGASAGAGPPASSDLVLLRMEPSLHRGEVVTLDAAGGTLSMGRALESAVRLYTATASRSHARLRPSSEGWTIEPEPGCRVSIDGDPTEEGVALELGMNLMLGGDHLRCERSSQAPRGERGGPLLGGPPSSQAGPGPAESGGSWNLRAAVGHFLRRIRGH